MSNYAKVNLLELEDSVGDRAPEVEGRFGRTPLGSRDIGVSHFRYAPGFRSPVGHHHREQEEAYVVVAGSGRVLLDGEVVELRQWDTVRVAPEVVRAFEAGPEGMDVDRHSAGRSPRAATGRRPRRTGPTERRAIVTVRRRWIALGPAVVREQTR